MPPQTQQNSTTEAPRRHHGARPLKSSPFNWNRPEELKAQQGSWMLAAARYHAGPDQNGEQRRLHGDHQYGRDRIWRLDA
jgi:hypothetical protein